MDFFLVNKNVVDRLVYEWKTNKSLIIAYDYDDTVYDYHNKGRTYQNVIDLLRRCAKIGAYFIVSTCCDKAKEVSIREFLVKNEIPFDSVNENSPKTPFEGRKIYANILLDDRAGLATAYKCLLKEVKIMEDSI